MLEHRLIVASWLGGSSSLVPPTAIKWAALAEAETLTAVLGRLSCLRAEPTEPYPKCPTSCRIAEEGSRAFHHAQRNANGSRPGRTVLSAAGRGAAHLELSPSTIFRSRESTELWSSRWGNSHMENDDQSDYR
jgi:hypothetical protein